MNLRDEIDRKNTCLITKDNDAVVYASDICKAAVRNTPYPGS